MKEKTKKILIELYLGLFFLIFLVLFTTSIKNNIAGRAIGINGQGTYYKLIILVGFIVYSIIGVFLLKKIKF